MDLGFWSLGFWFVDFYIKSEPLFIVIHIHCVIIVDRYLYVVHVREDSASLYLVNALSLLGIQLVETLVLALGLHPLTIF